ncbi:MAG: L-seryl-tRNA(Sec) selenium transferase [Myxococcota bacterium]
MASPYDPRRLLRRLPAVDVLTRDPRFDAARVSLGVDGLTRHAREVIASARRRVLETGEAPDHGALRAELAAAVSARMAQRTRRVINATGIVLHTNLGRAPLSSAAASALATTAGGYASIELDLPRGRRGARGAFGEAALAQLSGAEDALVVNNCAAAVLLALSAVARGRRVIVSRGEQVEIGGSFRVPEVLDRSGAVMVEVGTTNRTRTEDYARALDAHPGEVAALLRVHPSNFRQIGFTERPPLAELAALARARKVVLIQDLGGGALVDLSRLGLDEPMVQTGVQAGVHLVCFSCDKLLGGPQGGAIVGDRDLVARLRRDPLTRAVRLGRLPLVALEATLSHYLSDELEQVPALRALHRPLAEVRKRVEGWARRLTAEGVHVATTEAEGRAGGGTLPEAPVPSFALVFAGDVEAMAHELRTGAPAVLPRIHEGRLYVDGRTVMPDEDEALIKRLAEVVVATAAGGASRP